MKKSTVLFPIVVCLALAWLGCDDNDETKKTVASACEGNFSICVDDKNLMGCSDGRFVAVNCEDDEVCVEQNFQASCKNRTSMLCGNNVLDSGEQCDTTQLDFQSCSSILPGTDGRLLCNSQCKFDTTNCVPGGSKCGNQLIDTGEQCDGANLNGKTCADIVTGTQGTLRCDNTCQFDASGCTVSKQAECGNNVVEQGEQCDGANLNGKTCADIVTGTQGTLRCDNTCQFDVSGCAVSKQAECGNNIVEQGEQCDGTALNNKTCADVVHGTVGTLSCDSACHYVVDRCRVESGSECGNNIVETGEQCDGTNLNGKSCGDVVGGTVGSLSCANNCAFNTANCYATNPQGVCGDGAVNPGEQCDGLNLNGKTCGEVLPGTQGALSCSPQCQFVTTGCQATVNAFCGNNVVEAGEQCDGTNLNGIVCSTLLVGTQGVLSCDSCRFNTSQCTVPQNEPICGNGILEPGEQCDTNQFNGLTCKDIVSGTDGTLSCNGNCQIVTVGCRTPDPVCGNGVLEPGEQCDTNQFNGLTCKDIVSGTNGTLSCNGNCQIVTVGCQKSEPVCGNGVLEDGEQCDGTNLDNKTCTDVVSGSIGQLSCSSQCQFNTSQCKVSHPVVGTPCHPNQYPDVCYQDELYDCNSNTSLVEKISCKDKGMLCRTVPDYGDTCVMEDTTNLCRYENDTLFFSDVNTTCIMYNQGLIAYLQCKKIDNQFYIMTSLSNSVCANDGDGNYVVWCTANNIMNYEECGVSCQMVEGNNQIYGQCNNSDIPLVGQSCSVEGSRICSENHVLMCQNGKYVYITTCNGNTLCDTVTVENYTWADCTTECDSGSVDNVTSLDSECITDANGSHFGIYICKKTDNNRYREFYSQEVISICANSLTRFVCQNGLVQSEPCSNCTNIMQTEDSYVETTCGGTGDYCPTVKGLYCDISCTPVCSDDHSHAYRCGNQGTVMEWTCAGNVCDVSPTGYLTCPKELLSPCSTTVGESCTDCIPQCSMDSSKAVLCLNNKIVEWTCADNVCSVDGNGKLTCPREPLSQCIPNIGEECDSCIPKCSYDLGHAYLCVNGYIKEWTCANNVCSVDQKGNLTCPKPVPTTPCSTTPGDNCTSCLPVCSATGSNAYVCVNGYIREWVCANNVCSVSSDGTLTCAIP